MGRGYRVAIVGATGAVGNVMREILEERDFPVDHLRLLASHRSAGKKLPFKGEEITVEELKESSFDGVDIVLASAGSKVSKQFAPIAARKGCIYIDNSSAFRMDPEVPLVVPEVNPHAAFKHKGIIANPNCSTIQMVVALKPLHDVARIKRVVVSTYQSVSGAGWSAVVELQEQTRAILEGKEYPPQVFPYQIAFNAIPQIPQSDAFLPNGYTEEEMKMVNETRKIMEDDSIKVTATTVRIPVFYAHSESINIETERKLTAEEARRILSKAPGVKVMDDPENQIYPMPILAAGRDEVFVGRIREDDTIECGLNLWVVADNLRKGAALNAVQIAELLIGKTG
ncbi:aspartate-semialdehyde dehydrogenase [Candidatus Poribacteria bacterium]|nr:MAG: aspartate-semialdehyde dehydrogenase [Candidatus Poribacteria bacterium]